MARDVTGVGSDLLVDDDDPARLFSAWALHRRGDKVAEARNGEVSIDMLNAESFDLLTADMIMSKVIDAPTVTTEREKAAEILVVCISDYTDESVLAEVEALERVLFLPKPFSLKQLVGKVQKALELP